MEEEQLESQNSPQGEPSEPRRRDKQFDIPSWYYCSLWWRQYLYWQYYFQNSPSNITPPLPHPAYYTPTVVPNRPGITVQIRITNGYETYLAPLWRRVLAEFLDTIFVCLLLKWLIPILDFRIPEAMFLGSDEIMQMDDDEIEEVAWITIIFILSVLLERFVHSLMELMCIYQFGFTPGKWIMGLRIFKCTTIHETRTNPPRSVKIEPGTKLGLWQAALRTGFKSVISLFCPLIIFFIVLDRGRPQYDRAFRTVVVHYRYMYHPVASVA